MEDTHTINNYESLHAMVKKLEMEMVALKERDECRAARTTAKTAGSGGSGGFLTRGAVGNQVEEKGVDLVFFEIGIEGVVEIVLT